VIKLDLAGKLTSSPNDSSKVKVEMNGTEKGTMEISRKTGMAKSASIDMDAKMTAMGQPVDMKAKITIEGKE
jgi:hypothetical protein